MEEVTLTPAVEAVLVAYTTALARPWVAGRSKAEEEACREAGLVSEWDVEHGGNPVLHPTNRKTLWGGAPRRVFADPSGGLWFLAHEGEWQNAPGFYARCGTIEGAGPLNPLAGVHASECPGRCDCGYSSASLRVVWGDREERRAARAVLLAALAGEE